MHLTKSDFKQVLHMRLTVDVHLITRVYSIYPRFTVTQYFFANCQISNTIVSMKTTYTTRVIAILNVTCRSATEGTIG